MYDVYQSQLILLCHKTEILTNTTNVCQYLFIVSFIEGTFLTFYVDLAIYPGKQIDYIFVAQVLLK